MFSKTKDFNFNTQRKKYDNSYLDSHFKKDSNGRLFSLDNPVGQGQGPARLIFGKMMEPPNGTHWRYSQEKLNKLCSEGRIIITKTGRPRIKRYLDEMPGKAIGDVWVDIPEINSQAKERLGYPTQKPEALLERIIKASSNEGDLILDPFCGCGTAIAVAQKLNRKWIGIDITHLAISLMKHRLRDTFEKDVEYNVIGEPADLSGAQELAQTDPYQFQWWALGLVGARPVEQKKGADKGIDGRLFFHDDESGKTKQMIFSVKAGQVHASHVRDLNGVLEREKAVMGVLISMEEPTRNMVKEASASDLYESEAIGKKFPKIQIITTGELLEGKKIEMPYHVPATFKKAEKYTKKDSEQASLFDGKEKSE
jgi:hypothetical protein